VRKRVNIHEKVYLVHSDGMYIKSMGNTFDLDELYLFNSLIDIETVVLDVGANIGLTSIFFTENSKFVHSFEPSNTTFQFLTRNLEKYGNEKYLLHSFGLGSRNQTGELFYPSVDRASAFITESIVPHSEYIKEAIAIKKLDSISRSIIRHFDFMKIDVEGYELEVLRGAHKTIKRVEPVVTMEMNHFCLNAFQDISIPTFIRQLRKTFPKLFAVDGRSYLDLNSQNDAYHVAWDHIVNGRYKTIVGAFHEEQIDRFRSNFKYGIIS